MTSDRRDILLAAAAGHGLRWPKTLSQSKLQAPAAAGPRGALVKIKWRFPQNVRFGVSTALRWIIWSTAADIIRSIGDHELCKADISHIHLENLQSESF